MKKQKKSAWDPKNFALCRGVLALVLAFALMIINGFGFVYLLSSPTEITDGSGLAMNRYVSADVTYVMDICGEEVNEAGESVYYYAVTPLGNRFALIRFPADMLADVSALNQATLDFLTGESSVMGFHMPLVGMSKQADAEVYSLLFDWFEENKTWMSAAGVIGEDANATSYLVANVLQVDYAGSMPNTLSVLFSLAELVLVIYAIIVFIRMAQGKYNVDKKALKKAKREAEKAQKAAVKAEAETTAKAAQNKLAEEAKTAAAMLQETEAPADTSPCHCEASPQTGCGNPSSEEAPAEEVTAETAAEETPAEETAVTENADA